MAEVETTNCPSGGAACQYRAGRHTVPGPTRAFVRTAHNHTESLRANVHNGPGVQFHNGGSRRERLKALRDRHLNIHWPACAWAGPYTSMPSRYLSSLCCCLAWAYCSSVNQASTTNLCALSFPLFAARARCLCALPCLVCVHVTYMLTSECQNLCCVPVACCPCLVLL